MWDFLRWSINYGGPGTFLVYLAVISGVTSIGVTLFRTLGRLRN